jgi:hypothetical protein
MKPIQKLFTLICLLSLLLLSACGTAPEVPTQTGPGPLPTKISNLYYSYLDHEEGCKNSWVKKAMSGDANFAGFEIDSEAINTDTREAKNGSGKDALITFRIFLKSITIENYVVDIPNQTVTFMPTSPEAAPAQALDQNSVLIRANELSKTAPDLRVGILFSYYPAKFGNEEWNDFGAGCDSTNTQVFTIPW